MCVGEVGEEGERKGRERNERKREKERAGVSSSKDTNPIEWGPTLTTSFNLNYFLFPNTATMGVRTSTYKFKWGGSHITFSP